MSDPFEVPKWLTKLVRDWRDKLGLWEWRIGLKMANSPHGLSYAGGAVRSYGRTNEANIEFRIGIENNDDGCETVIHELLHIGHCRIDNVVDDVIIDALPEGCRSMARDAYDNVLETYIQHMAVQLLEIEREAFEEKGKKKARGK